METEYRYFGRRTEVGNRVLSKFGQRVRFEPDLALDVILGGGAILPTELFDQVGFTPSELSDKRERVGAAYLARIVEAQRLKDEHAKALKLSLQPEPATEEAITPAEPLVGSEESPAAEPDAPGDNEVVSEEPESHVE